jgi:hypothetical protein
MENLEPSRSLIIEMIVEAAKRQPIATDTYVVDLEYSEFPIVVPIQFMKEFAKIAAKIYQI